MKTNDTPYIKGIEGENLALQYCVSQGMKLITQRYKTAYGEIDLIMEDGNTIAFIEVKYRKTGVMGDGLIAVTPQKQKKLLLAANQYIQENEIDMDLRMDVVELTKDGIYYIKNAF